MRWDKSIKKNYKFFRIFCPVIMFIIFALTILIPQPYEKGVVVPAFWIGEGIENGYLNVPALAIFLVLMCVLEINCLLLWLISKRFTIEDLKTGSFELMEDQELPTIFANNVIKGLSVIEKVNKEERAANSEELSKEIYSVLLQITQNAKNKIDLIKRENEKLTTLQEEIKELSKEIEDNES